MKTNKKLEKKERRRIITEGKAKVVAAGLWDEIECCIITIQQPGRFEEKLLGEHPFWKGEDGGLVLCELDDQPFFQSIHFAK